MAATTTPDLSGLVGHRFEGGRYTIAHWENWLLTDCTGAEQLPDALVHPIALFHVPILGARTSIAELFGLFQASGAHTGDGRRVATYDVWLDRDGEHVVTGTAVVDVTTS